MRELRAYSLNFAFVRRSTRVLYWGLDSPMGSPRLWFLLVFNFGCQICGAYMLQMKLYPSATGVDKDFPGLAGCLKNGGGLNAQGKLHAAPGNEDFVLDYISTSSYGNSW